MGQIGQFLFDFVTDLRQQAANPGTVVKANAGTTAGDGLGGDYTWNSTSTAADDGSAVIKVGVVATGRWLRNPSASGTNIPASALLASDTEIFSRNREVVGVAPTVTPNPDTTDQVNISGLAANITIAAPSPTPTYAHFLSIRIRDNGTSRTITWNAIYRAGSDFILPTATVANRTMYIQFVYNVQEVKWDAVGLTGGFA